MPIYLQNPGREHKIKKKKKSKKGVPSWVRKKGFASWGTYMAFIRKQKGGEKTMAKKAHHKKTHRSNPPSSKMHYFKKKGYHRNPPMSMRGFMPMLMEGAIDAGEVVVGKAAARLVPSLFGFGKGTMMNMTIQAITAIGMGYIGHSFVSRNAGKMLLAGGLASPLEDIIKAANVPLISAALGEETDLIAAYPGDMSDYPESDLGLYPTMGEEDESNILVNY